MSIVDPDSVGERGRDPLLEEGKAACAWLEGSMPSYIKNLTFDRVDALRAARFWAAALTSDADKDSTAERAYVEAPGWGRSVRRAHGRASERPAAAPRVRGVRHGRSGDAPRHVPDDIAFHFLGHTPLSGDYNGLGEVLGYFGRLQQSGAGFKFEVHDLLADDEHAIGLVTGTAERAGKRVEQKVVHVFHMNADGKVSDWWNFWEDQAALDDLFA